MNLMIGNRTPNIVICGNYGATNLGDEAILDGILKIIRTSHPNAKITVLSSNPSETSDLHNVDSEFLVPAGIRSFWRGITQKTIGKTLNVIRDCDLFILGGGGLFTDEKLMAVMIWALQAKMAYFYGKPVFCLGQSVGPLTTFFGRNITRKVYANALNSTVRDHSSMELLIKLGVSAVDELADPVFALAPPEPIQEKPEQYVVMSVRPWIKGDGEVLYKKMAQFIDWLWTKHGLKSVLVPFQIVKDNDLDPLNEITANVLNKDSVEIFEYTSNYMEVMELMAKSSAVVGMRLHSLIFSSLVSTPFIALSYSRKVEEFAKQMGMENFILDWKDLKIDDLIFRFDLLMSKRSEVIENIIDRVIVLRGKTHKYDDILRSFDF